MPRGRSPAPTPGRRAPSATHHARLAINAFLATVFLVVALPGQGDAQDRSPPDETAADPPLPSSAAALDDAAAAIAGLDVPAALDRLATEIEADPDAPAPRRARAALHWQMQRPALALADLDIALAADPADLDALRLRVEIWQAQRAWNRARADLDAALAARPVDPQLLALRAEVNESAGAIDRALADYDAALAVAPDDPDLTAARVRLATSRAEREAAQVQFAPEAVMSDAYLVVEGQPDAPNTLHFVHAATDLARDYDGIDRQALARAVETGALRIVHLFTYTGRDASIWGNRALICAGPDGYAATHAALSDAAGAAALTATETGDFAPFERLLEAAYGVAGIDTGLVQTCARNRVAAARYLADWQAHHEAGSWRGVNLLDHWPAWVWNGTALGPEALSEKLAGIAPAPAPDPPEATAPATSGDPHDGPNTGPAPTAQKPPEDETDGPAARPTEPAAPAAKPDPTAARAPPDAPAPDAPPPDTKATAAATQIDASPPTATPAAPDRTPPQAPGSSPPDTGPDTGEASAVRFPRRPEPADQARVPIELRGVYAPSLAACLAYLDKIETPGLIDAVLPELNPLTQDDANADAQAMLGTILVTSRRVYLFNPLDTECAIAEASDGAADGWRGRFACASPLAPDARPALTLGPAPADGTAPRLSATYADTAPQVLRQCRALGQLGKAFAPLWSQGDADCTVTAPLARGPFAFSIDDAGQLVLRVAPAALPQGAGRTDLYAAVDGTPLGAAPGRWDGTGWQISLGPFATAADRLGWGMFLDVRATADTFDARLPLFGSSAAMNDLATCLAASE